MILDDALGWSDPSRLQRMGAAINAAGCDRQIIILTCTPGRYAHVGNVSTRVVLDLLLRHRELIEEFEGDVEGALLVLPLG